MHDHPRTDATLRRCALLGENAVRFAHELGAAARTPSAGLTASLEALLSSPRPEIPSRRERGGQAGG